MVNISLWCVSVLIYNFLTCKSIVHVSSSLSTNALDGCILLAIASRFKGQITATEKPLHMLVVVNVFLSVKNTHCAKS